MVVVKDAVRKLFELLILQDFEVANICSESGVLYELQLIGGYGFGKFEPKKFKFFEEIMSVKTKLTDSEWREVIHMACEILFTRHGIVTLEYSYIWDDALHSAIATLQKQGTTVYVVYTPDDDDLLYCTHPIGSTGMGIIRDLTLTDLIDSFSPLIEYYGYMLSEDLLERFWDAKEEMIKDSFWLSENEDFREQVWQSLFTCCVCDRYFEEDEDEELNESEGNKCIE